MPRRRNAAGTEAVPAAPRTTRDAALGTADEFLPAPIPVLDDGFLARHFGHGNLGFGLGAPPLSRKMMWGIGIGAGALLLGLGWTKRRDIVAALTALKTAAGRLAFKFAQPPQIRPWAAAILDASGSFNPFTVAAVMDRESGGGIFLRPKNSPAGTGDATSRWYRDDAVPAYANELRLLTGRQVAPGGELPPRPGSKEPRKNTSSRPMREVRAPMAGGATVPGWGYGLMQLDYAAYRAFIDSGDWRDPVKNIAAGVRELREGEEFFRRQPPRGATVTVNGKAYPDPRPLSGKRLVMAVIAGYNAADTAVLRLVASGRDPNAATTGKNYARDVLARVAKALAKFEGALPKSQAVAGLGGVRVCRAPTAAVAAGGMSRSSEVATSAASEPSGPASSSAPLAPVRTVEPEVMTAESREPSDPASFLS